LTKWVRTFGTRNNGLEHINSIAKEMNLHTLIGVYISTNISENNAQLQGLRNILQTGVYPDLIAVGNECNNSNLPKTYVPPKIIGDYIDSVRNIVRSKGLTIPIGSIDIGGTTLSQFLFQKLDFRGVNLYPGTHDTTPQSQMFNQLKTSWSNELSNTPSMMVLLTETGTPHSGGYYTVTGGSQTASSQKAVAYLENLITWMKEESIPCFYFEVYDEPTKGTGIERYFGLMDGNLQPHSFFKDILCAIPTLPNDKIEIQDDIKLLPSPTKDVFFLKADSKISIYNAQGRLLQKVTGRQIDLSVYPAGTYMIKVNEDIYKLVKQ